MQRSDEKLCLQWNGFWNNVSSTFKDLRDDKDFTDVTLACEDGQQVEAHKVVLIASSPFFLNLLKRNKHPHPLVYMRGLKFENLLSLVDFLYHGEANVFQDNLDSFLGMAEEFQLKGLDKMEEEPIEEVPKESKRKVSQSFGLMNNHIAKDNTPPQGLQGIADQIPISETVPTAVVIPISETVPAAVVLKNFSGCTDLDELDTKVRSMMAFSDNRIDNKRERARIYNVCGKEGERTSIIRHIEANHINDISIPCNICGKINKTRHGLRVHNRIYHS